MPVPTPVSTARDEPDPRITPAAIDFSQKCEDALRRVNEQKSAPDQDDVPPAGAVLELAPADRPPMRYLHGRSARATSQKTYRNNLRTVQRLLAESGFEHCDAAEPAEDFPWHLVGPEEATAFMAQLNATYANPHTVATLTTALRCVIRECARIGLMSPLRNLQVLESLPVRAVPPGRKGRELSDDEVARLLAACDDKVFIGERDAAMVAIAISTGLRGCELVDLDVGDVDLVRGRVYVRRLKGGRSHQTWLHETVIPLVEAWLNVRGRGAGPLFSSRAGTRLTTQSLQHRLSVLCSRSGVERATLHDLRRSCITKLLRSGVDPFVVARLVGHQKVTTTLRYDRRTELEDRAAMQALDFGDLGKYRRSPWGTGS